MESPRDWFCTVIGCSVVFRSETKLAHLIVDKTGTLTMGKPVLTDTVVLEGEDEATILTLAAALEKGSEHPLAEAIVAGAAAKGIAAGDTDGFEAVTGKGVRGKVGGRAVALGNAAMMQAMGLQTASAEAAAALPELHRG